MNTNASMLLAGSCIILTALIVVAVDPWAYRSFNALKQMLFITGTAVLITGFVFAVIIRKKKSLVLSVIELVILIRLIWLVVAHPDPGTYIQTTSFWLLISLLVFTMVCRQLYNYTPGYSRKELQSMFLQMVAGLSFFQAFAGIFQFYMIEPGDDLKTTVLGTLGAANGYGLLLSIGLLAHLGLLLQVKTRMKRLFLVTSMFFILSVLFLNESRGAMLSLAVSLTLFGFGRLQNKSCQIGSIQRILKNYLPGNLTGFKRMLAGGTIILLSGFAIFLYRVDIESSQGRWMVWQLCAPMLIENPLTGIGHGNYATEYLNYQSRWFQIEDHQSHAWKAANLKQAHNEFLQSFIEGGMPGGLLFLLLWLYPLFNYWKNRSKLNNTDLALFAILTAILFHSLVDSPLHVLPVTVIAFFILGMSPLPVIHFCSDKFITKFAMSFISVGFFVFVVFNFVMAYTGQWHWKNGMDAAESISWQKATGHYQHALEYLPDEGELHFHIGSALVMKGEPTRGLVHLEHALKNFNDRNIYLSRSLAFTELKQYGKAEENAHTALSMFPDHLAPHLLLGEIYHYTKLENKSKESLLKCIKQKTTVQSDQTKQISEDAAEMWKKFYGQLPK